MLTIRLNRTGKRNRPYFRVVLQEHTQAPGKRHVEILGSYDSLKKSAVLQKERITYWLGQGVQPSVTVHNLLVREGVIQDKKKAVKIPKPVAKEEPVSEEAEKPAEAAEEKVAEQKPEETGVVTENVPEKAAEAPAEEPKA